MQGQDVSAELTKSLEAIGSVLAARGRVRQKRSRPLRARLTLACPKVCPYWVALSLPLTLSALYVLCLQQLLHIWLCVQHARRSSSQRQAIWHDASLESETNA